MGDVNKDFAKSFPNFPLSVMFKLFMSRDMCLYLDSQSFNFFPLCIFIFRFIAFCFITIYCTRFNEHIWFASIKIKQSKILQCLIDTFTITWYIRNRVFHPFVEYNLVEGWFTIRKEKPYREEGRSKRLLGCDLSLQKN